MGIAFGSIGTGLPKDIVSKILEADKIPIQKMESRKTQLEDRKKLVQEVIDLFRDLQADTAKNSSMKELRVMKATYNDQVLDITLDQDLAKPGSYQVEVTQLAKKSTALSTGFEDPDESNIGVGFIQYTLPDGTVKDIYVDSSHSSLRGVAALINQNPDCGMRAQVVNDGTDDDAPWRLLISVDKTGDKNRAEFPYFYFVDGEDDFELEEERPAQDAKIKVDGFEMEIEDNITKDLIPGMTIEFKKALPGEELNIKVVEDREAITKKVSTFIEKINKILEFIIKQNQLDSKSDTRRTLGGDVTLQTVESKLRNLVFETYPTEKSLSGEIPPMRLMDIGITFQRSGLLTFDEKRFEAGVAKGFRQIAQMLVGYYNENEGIAQPGFVNKLNTVVNEVIRSPNGILAGRKGSIQSQMDQIDRQIDNRTRMIERKEQTLKDKFARLESTISQLKSQSAGVSAIAGSGMEASPVPDALSSTL